MDDCKLQALFQSKQKIDNDTALYLDGLIRRYVNYHTPRLKNELEVELLFEQWFWTPDVPTQDDAIQQSWCYLLEEKGKYDAGRGSIDSFIYWIVENCFRGSVEMSLTDKRKAQTFSCSLDDLLENDDDFMDDCLVY